MVGESEGEDSPFQPSCSAELTSFDGVIQEPNADRNIGVLTNMTPIGRRNYDGYKHLEPVTLANQSETNYLVTENGV